MEEGRYRLRTISSPSLPIILRRTSDWQQNFSIWLNLPQKPHRLSNKKIRCAENSCCYSHRWISFSALTKILLTSDITLYQILKYRRHYKCALNIISGIRKAQGIQDLFLKIVGIIGDMKNLTVGELYPGEHTHTKILKQHESRRA